MLNQLARLDLLFFAIFLICGWLVMLIDPSYLPLRRPLLILIGAPLFAALCCFAAFALGSNNSGRAATASAPLDVFGALFFTALTFLCALGGVIAVPIALRQRFREEQDHHLAAMTHHRHEHEHEHDHEHDHEHHHHHVDGDEAGHGSTSVRAVWIPRQQPPRQE